MIIKRVSATNLKGRTFSHALRPAQAICGPNFAGKSAIIEAIRLALIGHIPEIGKLPKATWELSSGPKMTVVAEFDDGDSIQRSYWLDGSSVKISAPDENRFESLPLLHAERYFGMTDNERTAYVFSMIKLPDSFTVAAIIAECERISFEEEHTEAVQEAKAEMIKDMADLINSRPNTVQELLTLAIESFREQYTFWNKRAKETQGAVTTMAELKLRETEVVAAAHGVDEQITKAQAELDRLNGEKGKLEAQQEEAERTANRSAIITRQLAGPVRDYDAAIEKLREKKVKLSPELEPDGRTLLVEAIAKAKMARAETAGKLAEQKRILTEALKRATEIEELTQCPYCHSKGKGWRQTLADELETTIKVASGAQAEARELLAGMDDALEKMEATLFESDESKRKNAVRRLEQESTANQIKALERDQAADALRRNELAEELKELAKRPAAKDLTKQLQVSHHARSDCADLLNSLTVKKDAETRLQHDLKRAAEAELEHLSAKAHVLVIKAIANLLKEKREAMITEAFAGLLKIANKVAGGILKKHLDLHENTVGMWNGAKFIPHRVFSGTEKALCYIAIATALSAQAPLKLVILDEFGRLDEENQYKVLLRLAILVEEKTIDQFIVVGTSLPEAMKTSQVHLEVIEVKP